MGSKLILSITVTLASLALVSSIPRPVVEVSGVGLAAPWPEVVQCNYTETPGASCLDCERQLICSPIGGIVVTCWWPLPHCVDGLCSNEPSEQCTSTEPSSTSSPEWTTEAYTDVTYNN